MVGLYRVIPDRSLQIGSAQLGGGQTRLEQRIQNPSETYRVDDRQVQLD